MLRSILKTGQRVLDDLGSQVPLNAQSNPKEFIFRTIKEDFQLPGLKAANTII